MVNTTPKAVCPLCTRVINREDVEELELIVENHNQKRHGQQEVAQILGRSDEEEIKDELDSFMKEVKEEYGHSVHRTMSIHIVEADPWGIL